MNFWVFTFSRLLHFFGFLSTAIKFNTFSLQSKKISLKLQSCAKCQTGRKLLPSIEKYKSCSQHKKNKSEVHINLTYCFNILAGNYLTYYSMQCTHVTNEIFSLITFTFFVAITLWRNVEVFSLE